MRRKEIDAPGLSPTAKTSKGALSHTSEINRKLFQNSKTLPFSLVNSLEGFTELTESNYIHGYQGLPWWLRREVSAIMGRTRFESDGLGGITGKKWHLLK